MCYLLAAWILLGGIFGGFVQIIFAMEDYEEEFPIKTAVFFATRFYENYACELNRFGLIIAIVFILIATLPGSILIAFSCAMIWLFSSAWELFRHLFRKKKT